MRVKKAEYVKDYKIKLVFSDGAVKIVDFKPFLKNAKNLFLPLLDLEYFKRFSVDDTTISWPNEVDFCPDVLYEIGSVVKTRAKSSSKRSHRRVAPSSHSHKSTTPIAAKSK